MLSVDTESNVNDFIRSNIKIYHQALQRQTPSLLPDLEIFIGCCFYTFLMLILLIFLFVSQALARRKKIRKFIASKVESSLYVGIF